MWRGMRRRGGDDVDRPTRSDGSAGRRNDQPAGRRHASGEASTRLPDLEMPTMEETRSLSRREASYAR
jgi:hypothetical protein